jgi:hypothetical protein
MVKWDIYVLGDYQVDGLSLRLIHGRILIETHDNRSILIHPINHSLFLPMGMFFSH